MTLKQKPPGFKTALQATTTVLATAMNWLRPDQFVLGMWALSRLVLVIAIVGIAPALADGHNAAHLTFGWAGFLRHDGEWYEKIATAGYDYAPDGKMHTIPFFPFFPLVCRGLMALGCSFPLAGVVINSLAFLGALMVIYRWMGDRYDRRVARWTVAILVWSPMALYSMVTYTEGLFLLLSTLALRSFDQKRHGQAALWGALATATRLAGVMLVPTFAIVALRQRRVGMAYAAAAIASLGFLLYVGFCTVQFGEPLAFLKVQAAFGQRSEAGFSLINWGKTFVYAVVGRVNWETWTLKNPLQPFQVGILGMIAYGLYWGRSRLASPITTGITTGIATGLWLLWWVLWGDGLIKTGMVIGSLALLGRYWRQLPPVLAWYGSFALGLVLFSGSIISTDRYAFGITTVAAVSGLFLSHHPRLGRPILGAAAYYGDPRSEICPGRLGRLGPLGQAFPREGSGDRCPVMPRHPHR